MLADAACLISYAFVSFSSSRRRVRRLLEAATRTLQHKARQRIATTITTVGIGGASPNGHTEKIRHCGGGEGSGGGPGGGCRGGGVCGDGGGAMGGGKTCVTTTFVVGGSSCSTCMPILCERPAAVCPWSELSTLRAAAKLGTRMVTATLRLAGLTARKT